MSRHRKPKPVAPTPTKEQIAQMFAETKGERPEVERPRRVCPGCGRPVSRYCGAHCFGDHDYDEGSVWWELGHPSNFGDQ